MKVFLFFFVLLFSFNVNAMTICINDSGDPDSCVDDGSSQGDSIDGVNCYYNKDLGVTQCNTVLGDGSIGGYWDPTTFTCSNFVAPVVGSTGEPTCPPTQPVSVKSKTTPNPSKDDKACDPTKSPDPLKPDEGCASQQTAIKTNDLLSEANSKLGSISGTNSANTGLLGQILGTLRGIASQGSDSSGTDYDSQIRENTTDKQSVSFSSEMSGFGMCPPPESFNVMGNNYQFSYESICYAADSFRGLVIAMGVLSALMIVVTAL